MGRPREVIVLQWAATGKRILALQPSSVAVFYVVNSGFIDLQFQKLSLYKTIYGEASVMFRTLLTVYDYSSFQHSITINTMQLSVYFVFCNCKQLDC